MHVEIPKQLADDPWFKVVDMLQQNWAVVIAEDDQTRVVFYDDTCGVFDELRFTESSGEVEAALRRNGFAKFSEDAEAASFISLPDGNFHKVRHPNGPIYSSGRFWR